MQQHGETICLVRQEPFREAHLAALLANRSHLLLHGACAWCCNVQQQAASIHHRVRCSIVALAVASDSQQRHGTFGACCRPVAQHVAVRRAGGSTPLAVARCTLKGVQHATTRRDHLPCATGAFPRSPSGCLAGQPFAPAVAWCVCLVLQRATASRVDPPSRALLDCCACCCK